MTHFRVAFLALIVCGVCGSATQDSLSGVLSLMDAQSAKFHAIRASFKRTSYTKVIDSSSDESGTFVMRRMKDGKVQAVMNVLGEDAKAVGFRDHKVEFYYPKMNEVHEVDLGKRAPLVDQFLLLGFGTSGQDLQQGYDVKLLGNEKISGQDTDLLELTPKSAEARHHLTKVELWIDSTGGYPVQQKFYQPSGDYTLMVFSNVKINPELTAAEATLKLPNGVKRVKQ